jgi:hypothetical protein
MYLHSTYMRTAPPPAWHRDVHCIWDQIGEAEDIER